MTGMEFIAAWIVALTVTGLIVGWAFVVQTFGLPVWVETSLGVGIPIAGVMGVTWLAVRQ